MDRCTRRLPLAVLALVCLAPASFALPQGHLQGSDVVSRRGATMLHHGGLLALRGGSDSFAGVASSAAALAANPDVAKSVMSSVSGSSALTNPRNIGLIMIVAGVGFSMLGFMLFMNSTLIGTGNLMVIAGTVLFVGHKRTSDFLFRCSLPRGWPHPQC
jgi:hypothetical protein